MKWLLNNWDQVLVALFRAHRRSRSPRSAIAFVLSLGIGIWAARNDRVFRWAIAISGFLYTIPTLAFLALLIPIVGLGRTNAIICMVAFSLMIMIRNVATGIRDVPRRSRRRRRGMGMSRVEILTRIELPLALPVIVAGLRIATVTVISVAVVAAYVNAGGLGTIIFNGISNDYAPKIWTGALTACALAVAADLGLARARGLAPASDRLRRAPAPACSSSKPGSSSSPIRGRFFAALWTHVALSAAALGIAIAIAVPAGVLARRTAPRRAGRHHRRQYRAHAAVAGGARAGDADPRHRFRAVAVRADAARAAADPDQHLHGDAPGRPRHRRRRARHGHDRRRDHAPGRDAHRDAGHLRRHSHRGRAGRLGRGARRVHRRWRPGRFHHGRHRDDGAAAAAGRRDPGHAAVASAPISCSAGCSVRSRRAGCVRDDRDRRPRASSSPARRILRSTT